jgi:ribosomal protein L30/L7E
VRICEKQTKFQQRVKVTMLGLNKIHTVFDLRSVMLNSMMIQEVSGLFKMIEGVLSQYDGDKRGRDR